MTAPWRRRARRDGLGETAASPTTARQARFPSFRANPRPTAGVPRPSA